MTETTWVILFLVAFSFLVGFLLRSTKPKEQERPQSAKSVWKNFTDEGLEAYKRGDLPEAEDELKYALQMASTLWPIDHHVVESYRNLAKLYPGGFYALMALATEDVVEKEEELGRTHPEVVDSLERLAGLYAGLEYHSLRARKLYKEALRIREETQGHEHIDTVKTYENLVMLEILISYAEGSPEALSWVLQVRERALGPDHLEVARTLENLAGLSSEEMGYGSVDALKFIERALEIHKKVLGPKHPRVATTLRNLALQYCEHDREEEAEPLFRRALEIREQALGPEHPYVASSINDLIYCCYFAEDSWSEGEPEPLILKSIGIFERVFDLDFIAPDMPIELPEKIDLMGHRARQLFIKERLELKVEVAPEDFAEGQEVRFERVSVTDKEIILTRLVTKPARSSAASKGREAGELTRKVLTPQEVLGYPDLVPQKYGHTTWNLLGEAISIYGWLTPGEIGDKLEEAYDWFR